MKRVTNIIIVVFFLSVFWGKGLAQCPPGKEYPFHVCPGDNIVCMSCPRSQLGPGQSVLGAGLPTSICIDDARTGSTDGNIGMFDQNNGPCATNKVANVFNAIYMNNDAQTALNAWKGICSPNPTTDCCWNVVLVSNPDIFRQNNHDPDKDPAFTKGLKCGESCSNKQTILNFTSGFMRPITVKDVDGNGDPCDFDVFTTSFFNPELDGNVQYTPTSGELNGEQNYFLNVVDILIHELGHLLGYPDELALESSGLPCALDGVMHSKNWDDFTSPSSLGFPSGDPARCWFKLTYCDPDCTEAVEITSSRNGLTGIIFPNPVVKGSTLLFDLVKSAHTQITIYDILGKQIQTLFSGFQEIGSHTISIRTESLPSGTYICRLNSGSEIKSIRFSVEK